MEYRGNKYGFKIGEGGRVLNPSAKSDDKGMFSLELDRSFFTNEELKDIRLAVDYIPPRSMVTRGAPLKSEHGIPISLSIVDSAANLDLGKITVTKQ